MTENEFEIQYADFLKQFNEVWEAPANIEALNQIVLNATENEEDIARNYLHTYLQQRMDNLVKLALIQFLKFDSTE